LEIGPKRKHWKKRGKTRKEKKGSYSHKTRERGEKSACRGKGKNRNMTVLPGPVRNTWKSGEKNKKRMILKRTSKWSVKNRIGFKRASLG